jgi:hypothetical protein
MQAVRHPQLPLKCCFSSSLYQAWLETHGPRPLFPLPTLLHTHLKESNQLLVMARSSSASTQAQVQNDKRTRKTTRKAAQTNAQSTDATVAAPSALKLLSQSLQTTDEWFKSVRTKKGYANYVKNGKKLLAEWTADDCTDEDNGGFMGVDSDREGLGRAFDEIAQHTPTALRLVMAYKCEHLGRAFSTAEGLRSAFKHFFER